MKKIQLALITMLSLVLLISCGQASNYEKQSFFAMDTMVELRFYSTVDHAAEIFAGGKAVVSQIENAISVTKEGGDTFRLNAADGAINNSAEHLTRLIEISEEISSATGGSFDIRTGAMISLWKQCEDEGRLPTEEELSAAVALAKGDIFVEGTRVSKSDADMKLDFGAIGKGYAADILVGRLRASGVTCGMISFVSTVTVFGERAAGDFCIAIRRPDTSGELAGYVTLHDASLSVSGNYERYYEIGGVKYDHILDPETGYPAEGVESVVVIAESGAYADALSTAITVMGAEKTQALYESGRLTFEAALFVGDEILVTDGFSENFELADNGYTVVLLSDRH